METRKSIPTPLLDCVFCHIATGNVASQIVHEDELCVAFLDIQPIRPGHVQIIPRDHYETFEHLPPATAARIVVVGQQLSKALKEIYGVERVAFMFTGGDVPHAHAHVVPMQEKTDITSRRYFTEETLTFRPLPDAPVSELSKVAASLGATLRKQRQ